MGRGETDKAMQRFAASFHEKDESAEKSLVFLLQHLSQQRRYQDALGLLQQACEWFPQQDKWPATMAEMWNKLGDVEQAIACADRALELNPNNATVFINRICWLASRCDDPAQVRALFESWGHRFMDPLTDQASPLCVADRDVNKRLRVGYVSGDFKNHSVRYFIEPILRQHDREQVEVHAFMTMPGDDITPLLKNLVDHWHEVKDLDDVALHRLIRELNIDVLVDLSGHTAGERLAVFARRAAPVQVTWFGFMQTLGMKAMDWRLSDPGSTPEGTDAHYTEKLYRMSCMVAYTPPLNAETLFDSPYQANGYVTMVCMNHTRKISQEALAVWRDILVDNPTVRLVLISQERDATQAVQGMVPRLQALDFPLERVEILPNLTMSHFLVLASVADFALDPFPISGGTTTLHALWMGLPTLTLEDTQRGAMSSSTAAIMSSAALDECVAHSVEEYRQLASSWIKRPEVLPSMRWRCRDGLQRCALMDHAGRTREVEQAYRSMWTDYLHHSA